MFYLLSKTLDLAFSPLCVALLLGAACAWAARRGRVRVARWLGLAAALLLYVPSTGAVARALRLYAARFDGPLAEPDVTYDAVILLGGFVGRGADGVVELSEGADRLLMTWQLLHTGRATRAVIAGGADPEQIARGDAEAQVAADLLHGFGIARERMLLDITSRNTRENALEVRALADRHRLGRMVVVTSAFHMQRALGCLRAVGLEVDAAPVDLQLPHLATAFDLIAPRAGHLRSSEIVLRELAGRLIYRMRGYAR